MDCSLRNRVAIRLGPFVVSGPFSHVGMFAAERRSRRVRWRRVGDSMASGTCGSRRSINRRGVPRHISVPSPPFSAVRLPTEFGSISVRPLIWTTLRDNDAAEFAAGAVFDLSVASG